MLETWNFIGYGDSNWQDVTNDAEISQVESLITVYQGWLVSSVCYGS